jgi:HlyD family secretion protein
MVVLAGKQSHARVYVPESLRVLVNPGTPALIHIDGLAYAILGRVWWVSSDAAFTPYFALTERDRGRLSYLAKVDVAEDMPRFPDGVPVEVELLIGSTD